MFCKGAYSKNGKKRWVGVITVVFFISVLICAVFVRISQDTGENKLEQSDPLAENTQVQSEVTAVTYEFEDETVWPDHEMPTETEDIPTATSATEAEPAAQTAIIQKPVSQEDIDGYAPVIQQYREAYMLDSKEYFSLYGFESELDLKLSIDALRQMVNAGEISEITEILETPLFSDRFPYVAGSTMYTAKFFEESFDPSVYYYAYYDIDGSRSHELLIGEYNDYSDEYSILAIYTLNDDEPRLLQDLADDSRWHLTIYADGTYCLDGSGGASIHYWHYFRMHDMFSLDEPTDSFTIRYDTPRSEYMHEVQAGYEAMLTPVTDFLWHPIMEC